MEKIIGYICEQVAKNRLDKETAKYMLKYLKRSGGEPVSDIAVIGMGGRFSDCDNLDEYWEKLVQGRSCITKIPRQRMEDYRSILASEGVLNQEQFIESGFLKEIDKFDPDFFHIPPAEAEAMEPLQRLLLEIAWETLENGGCIPGHTGTGGAVGVYIGRDYTDGSMYKYLNPEPDPLLVTGTWTGLLASRISYCFNFTGPSVVIDSACSSGLTAVHNACSAIQNKECTMALAGGIHLLNAVNKNASMDMVTSSDYTLRAFDRDANGTVWGEGAGMLLLKPLDKALKDGDIIHGIIKGSAVNNDGASNGITAPNAQAQEEVLCRAWENSGISPETIDYIEAHGTGTKLGDPIEITALENAIRKSTNRRQFCGIGSVKTNLGHTVGASGLASIIKVILCMKYETLVPTIHFEAPNPYIPFSDSPVYVSDRKKDWKRKDTPRRAGVTSFGFSGTNCHIVLEEAPKQISDSGIFKDKKGIFTISAKKEEALFKIINQYLKIDTFNSNDILELCYNTGIKRGHYNYRAAIVAGSFEELKHKLRRLLKMRVSEESEGIYYGFHKVVSGERRDSSKGLITEGEKRERTSLAAHLPNSSEIEYMKISKLYIAGADIDWKRLYDDKKYRTIQLPTYPLDKKRCWYRTNGGAWRTTVTDGIYERIVKMDTRKEVLYELQLYPDRDWILDEHRVTGTKVLPGTGLLELVARAGQDYWQSDNYAIKDIYFLKPIIAVGEKLKLQIIIDKTDEEPRFIVAVFQPAENNWAEYAEGRLVRSVEREPSDQELPELEKDFVLLTDQIKLNENNQLFQLGEHFDCMKRILQKDGDYLIELKLKEEFKDETDGFLLHPALLDSAVNGMIRDIGNDFYLPFGYGEIRFFHSLPGHFYSYMKQHKENRANGEILTFDILLFDEQKKILAKIQNYTIKKWKETAIKLEDNPELYEMIWKEYSYQASIEKPCKCIIISNMESVNEKEYYHAFTDELKLLQTELLEIQVENDFDILNKPYRIRNSIEDFKKLFQKLDNKDTMRIILLNILSKSNDSPEYFSKENSGLYLLFHLIKAMEGSKWNQPTKLTIITNYASPVTGKEERIHPINEAVVGLAKAINVECPHISCNCIDVDSERNIKKTAMEALHPSKAFYTAHRQGKSYVQQLQTLKWPLQTSEGQSITKYKPLEHEHQQIEMKENGVYMITGAFGGIGIELGRYLSATKNIHLVLVGRDIGSEDPDVISDVREKVVRNRQYMEEMKEKGIDVVCMQSDVSQNHEMQEVFIEIKDRFGRLDGIFHCAGVAGDGFLIRKEEADFEHEVGAKILGTQLLDYYSKDFHMDFFLMFSSFTSLLGIPGQGGYIAANSFLNSFGGYQSVNGRKGLTVLWPLWKDTGMAADFKVKNSVFLESIQPAQGLGNITKLLNLNKSMVIMGRLSKNRGKEAFIPFSVSESIATQLGSMRRDSGREEQKHSKISFQLGGREDNKYTDTERQMGRIWAEISGMCCLDIYDTVYDLGMDSILALKIINRWNERAETKVFVGDFFEYASIYKLAEYIDNQSMLKGRIAADKSTGICVPVQREAVLSSMQERIWFLQKYNPEMTVYQLPSVTELAFKVDRERFNAAVHYLIENNGILRTVYKEKDGRAVPLTLHKLQYEVAYEDLSATADNEEILRKRIFSENQKVFDLTKPLFFLKLYKMEEERYILHLNFHHIIMDGWSIRLFLKGLREYYDNGDKNLRHTESGKRAEYEDWVWRQEQWKASEDCYGMEEYWLKELKKPLPILNLPNDLDRPKLQTYNGSFLTFSLDEDITALIKEKAKEFNCTVYMFLLSIYFAFLNKITNEEDIIVGTPITGRDGDEWDEVMGLFINTLCIRIDFLSVSYFHELVEQVKLKSIDAYRNGKYPFDLLVAKLNPKRDLARSPVFSTLFQYYEDIPVEQEGRSMYELSILCREAKDKIVGRLEYNSDLFSKNFADRLLQYFTWLIQDVISKPDALLSELDILTKEERNYLVYTLNPVKIAGGMNRMVHERLEDQAEKNPKKTAYIYRNQSITYEELNKAGDTLAVLLSEKGAEPDSFVGVMIPRSISFIKAVMGILKAGAAYLPIDPGFPKERVDYMLKDSNISILITDDKTLPPDDFKGCIINISHTADLQSEHRIKREVKPEHAAYMIYTSGSTGKPKGIVIEHKSVNNFVEGMMERIPLEPQDKILALTTVSFDIFFLEMVLPAAMGMTVVIADKEEEADPYLISRLIKKHEISILQATPTRMQLIFSAVDVKKSISDLKAVLIGGEEFQSAVLKQLKAETSARIFNMYGPTETTIWSCVKELTDSSEITIGTPIRNTSVYILDKNNCLMPFGMTGELCIGGEGVARGYWGREELTAERFIENPNPYMPDGGRIYKTGDLVKWTDNKELICFGRTDNQIKFRGYRIELGEIEAILSEYPSVIRGAATWYGERDDEKRIVCFYTGRSEVPTDELKKWMSSHLPEYMIPAEFLYVDKLPETPNGKIDKNALRLPTRNRADSYRIDSAPVNETQQLLSEIWSELLKTNNPGIYDNFFDMGGNSLLVGKMQAMIQNRLGVICTLTDLFLYPTIDSLSDYLIGKDLKTEDLDCKSGEDVEEDILTMLTKVSQGEASMDDVLKTIEEMEVSK